MIHVPTQPGTHTRYVNVFKPVSSSILSDLVGDLSGKPAEFMSFTELLYKNSGREVTRVVSAGTIKVQFCVTMKDLDKIGVYPFKA